VVAVRKKSIAASSANDGAFETSTTTAAPSSTGSSPSPVTVFTPVLGAAATASWPCSANTPTSVDPISPVPPITTTFTVVPRFAMRERRRRSSAAPQLTTGQRADL
jgi:hypothetical protein